ncbi:MAG: hypothetical protein S4CHLAM7_13440 [Chlamydiae bacterium]|nr:hypothetical protein [Chlamydiota bacterium]
MIQFSQCPELPESMPGDLYQFMHKARPEDTLNCLIKVNGLAVKFLHPDTQKNLQIGSKKLHHIADNIYTVKGLTKSDLELVYHIGFSEVMGERGKDGVPTGTLYLKEYVSQKIAWIKQIECATPIFPLSSEISLVGKKYLP